MRVVVCNGAEVCGGMNCFGAEMCGGMLWSRDVEWNEVDARSGVRSGAMR